MRVVRHVYNHGRCCNATSETVTVNAPVDESSATYVPPVTPRCTRFLGAELYCIERYMTAVLEPRPIRDSPQA